MATQIKGTIQEDGLCICEGGTGIGKSYAALMAALLIRQEINDEDAPPIVYSTGTVALQEQIIGHDFPSLCEMLEQDFIGGLAKGRGRYMCPKKLFNHGTEAVDQTLEMFNKEDRSSDNNKDSSMAIENELKELEHVFSNKLWDGDIDAYQKTISSRTRARITIDGRACLGRSCSLYDGCPYYEFRKHLRECDVIVVNHDLLLSDLALGGGKVIPCKPEDTIYLIDEAHRLPSTAVNHFGSKFQLKGSLEWLDSYQKALNRTQKIPTLPIQAKEFINKASGLISNLNQSLQAMQSNIAHNEIMFEKDIWQFDTLPESCMEPIQSILHYSGGLLKDTIHILNICTTDDAKLSMGNVEVEKIQSNFWFFQQRIRNLFDCATMLLKKDDIVLPPIARWVKDIKGTDYQFNAFPTFASEYLNEALWSKAKAAIAYSATLRTLGNFEHFLKVSGLKQTDRDVKTCSFTSPFNYTRSTIHITGDSTDPDNEDHERLTATMLSRVIENGSSMGVLVLFTSSRKMNRVREIIKSDGNISSKLLVQDDMPKKTLIARHKESIEHGRQSIIFGLASFAEGIDLPGNFCTAIIIPRIPFPVPTSPMEKACQDWINKSGGNSFKDYMLPMASERFTQMIGRLIRTENDAGNIIVLDPRICTKPYGKLLLGNIPGFTVRKFSSKSFH